MNRKLCGYALAAALSLGTVGGTLAYAADPEKTSTAEEASTEKGKRGLENIDEATKSKIEEIWEQVETELEALGVALPERFANLVEETKAKAEAIFGKVKEGTLSREEAKSELETLGVTILEKQGRQDFLAGLDDETKEKAEAQLEELGVEAHLFGGGRHHGHRHGH